MFDIHDLSAAPHFPEALKANVERARPESLLILLARAFDGDRDESVEVRMREGEIFIALTASC